MICARATLVALLALGWLGVGFARAQPADEVESLKQRFEQSSRLSKHDEAIAAARQILELREKKLGAGDPGTLSSLIRLAGAYQAARQVAEAERWFQRAVDLSTKKNGPDHDDTLKVIASFAGLYRHTAQYAKAEPLCRHVLKAAEKKYGPEHRTLVSPINNLGVICKQIGDYPEAESLYQRALRIAEKEFGFDHPDTAACIANLAGLFHFLGDYAQADRLDQRALQIQEKTFGPGDPRTAFALHNLAVTCDSRGDYAQAERLNLRALRIREKAFSPHHLETAASVNNLGLNYYHLGEFARAEQMLLRGVSIEEKELGPDHPSVANSLKNLALVYQDIHDDAKARPLCERALRIVEKAFGPDHPETAGSLFSLATVYVGMREYTRAEELTQRALRIQEKALGPDHPKIAFMLNSLAASFIHLGEPAKAEPLLLRALRIRETALGPDHPSTAATLLNLAFTRVKLGDFAAGEAYYARAVPICRQRMGPDHPKTWISQANQSRALLAMGRAGDALPLAAAAAEGQLQTLSNVLSFASERQRLAYQSQARSELARDVFGSVGSAPDLALSALRHKGVVLDSLLEDHLTAQAATNPETGWLIEELRLKKLRLTQLIFASAEDSGPSKTKSRPAERVSLSREVEELEGTLARHVAGLGRSRRALSVTVPEVQSALPRQAVLIEFIRYRHLQGSNDWQPRYGAVMVPVRGDCRWASLGPAAAIDTDLAECHALLRGAGETERLIAVLKSLYARVWQPIEPLLPDGTRTVILSPEGQLNFLSFATLLTPGGRWLGENFTLHYVASGRDLLRPLQPSSSRELMVFADADFAGAKAAPMHEPTNMLIATRSIQARELDRIRFEPLPGTGHEGDALIALAQRWGWPATALAGPRATETRLHALQSPRILHLATHGFFLGTETAAHAAPGRRGVGGVRPAEDTSADATDPGFSLRTTGMLKNPMARGGLALAGAQATIDAWKQGEYPPTANDGIVTAEEVATLKLDGTWLVALSACDTGSGEARSGEGVLGLRRGFIQAGAQNLLMTLWPVADKETADFMVDFYEAAHKTGNAPQALAEVQRDWLVKLRKERGVAEAVRLAGPFVMTSQGNPK